MSAEKIVVDGVEYKKVGSNGEKMMIVCVDNRGLTFIGKCNLDAEGEWITIRDARCIIYWGTSNHIAELTTGPNSETRLGAKEDVIVRRHNIVFAYEAGEAWNE